MQPDAGHLHSLVFRKLVSQGHSAHAKQSVRRANARVAPRMWLHGAICLIGALVLHNHNAASIAFVALYAGFYVVCYRSLAHRHDGPPGRMLTPHAGHTEQRVPRIEPHCVARR